MAFVKSFTYNGRSLTEVFDDLVVIGFHFSGANDSTILSRTVNRSPLTYDESIAYDYGAIDNGVFTFSLTIARKDAQHLTQIRVRNIISWLMEPTEPKWLTLEICENIEETSAMAEIRSVYKDVEFKGRFVNAAYAESPGYFKDAITFTFENISPYGYTPMQTYYFNHTASRDATTYTVIDNDHGCPGTFVGKLVSPIVLIRSLGNKEDDCIETQDLEEYITDQTNDAGIEVEQSTVIDPNQTITIYNGVANTETFKIVIPNGTCVAVMDDNCYYYDAGTNNENVDYITQAFDPTKVGELYSFENLSNFNWPKMTSGTNRIRISGVCKVQFFARFYEALGI